MKKTTIFVGLNDKDTKVQEISIIDAYKILTNIFVKTTGGVTITEGRGVYTHEDGTIVIETTLICTVYGAENDSILTAVKMIKTALNQESVIAENTETDSNIL